MAKKTKDLETVETKATKSKKTASKKTTAKKTSTVTKKASDKKTATTKKSTTKKAVAKKAVAVKKTTATKKTAAVKKATATKKVTVAKKAITTKKATVAKKATAAKKTVSTKESKSATKSTTTKKASTKRTSRTKSKTESSVKKDVKKFQAEYYDLPYIYNKTIVKVLAQTPKMLFIYWEISETDRNNFLELYGENFFNNTKPFLIVYNDTMNYSFEVEIDDFANSWYLHINDANCEYHVELGRKPIPNLNHQNQPVYIPYYIYVTSSNEMTSPNNTILFNPNIKTVTYRNVKTGEVIEKDINNFVFITNIGMFSIKELYNYLFPNENFEFENIVLGNTSSGAIS